MALTFKHGDDPLRVYLDTSVFGGCFDEMFAEDSLRLVAAIRDGHLRALISDIVVTELEAAPEPVRNVMLDMRRDVQLFPVTEEVRTLQQAYLAAEIVTPRYENDAVHVAAATIARADAIVSWNFRHIVRLEKIKAYNQVNFAMGYGILTILSPTEVTVDDQ